MLMRLMLEIIETHQARLDERLLRILNAFSVTDDAYRKSPDEFHVQLTSIGPAARRSFLELQRRPGKAGSSVGQRAKRLKARGTRR